MLKTLFIAIESRFLNINFLQFFLVFFLFRQLLIYVEILHVISIQIRRLVFGYFEHISSSQWLKAMGFIELIWIRIESFIVLRLVECRSWLENIVNIFHFKPLFSLSEFPNIAFFFFLFYFFRQSVMTIPVISRTRIKIESSFKV